MATPSMVKFPRILVAVYSPCLRTVVSGHHDDRNESPMRIQPLLYPKRPSIQVGHVEIKNDGVRLPPTKSLQGDVAVVGFLRLIAVVLQALLQRLPEAIVVVNDQNTARPSRTRRETVASVNRLDKSTVLPNAPVRSL
jgi:hypothetical protein